MLEANEYAVCFKASERAAWSLADAVSRLDLDFSRRFLPRRIFGGDELEFLDRDELRLLNHIRGFSYAHLFLFVEEYIILQVTRQARQHEPGEPDATRALLRFAAEETKHQDLFRALKARLVAKLGECGEIGGMTDVARFIVSKPPLAVMLLTSLLEWITQRHYLECFQDNKELDPAFSEVFRLHWVEEAQHARLDTLEIQALCAGLGPAEREAAIDVLIELLAAVDGLLAQQVELDITSFERLGGRTLTAEQRERTRIAQHAANRWTFIVSGLEHRVFRRIVGDVSPTGAARLVAEIKKYGS
jgi:hypothetical protein